MKEKGKKDTPATNPEKKKLTHANVSVCSTEKASTSVKTDLVQNTSITAKKQAESSPVE